MKVYFMTVLQCIECSSQFNHVQLYVWIQTYEFSWCVSGCAADASEEPLESFAVEGKLFRVRYAALDRGDEVIAQLRPREC